VGQTGHPRDESLPSGVQGQSPGGDLEAKPLKPETNVLVDLQKHKKKYETNKYVSIFV